MQGKEGIFMIGIFWGSILSVFYAYFGYPLILVSLSKIIGKKVKPVNGYTPKVTLITTVHNEAKRIEKKISNILNLNYPPECLEVIFASDASTDMTDNIVQEYTNQGIKLVRSPRRGGKESAQKYAIEQAHGEILVFTDVATILEKDGIKRIIKNFADPTVGCVSSEDRVVDEKGRIGGESAYVKYEMWIRSLETRVNSVVGLSGSFFAARKEVCENWPTDIPSDFNTLLNSIKMGYRGISDPFSIGIYTNIKDEKKEFDRKVRTITRGISALFANKALLNPFVYGIFSWQLLSHKLMRWFVPWFLFSALIANIILFSRKGLYRVLLVPHMIFYILSFVGHKSNMNTVILKIPFYFVQVNRAIVNAWIKYLSGERFITWTPSSR
jgi:glycosyltransferase involved in cell wall biosynthesis